MSAARQQEASSQQNVAAPSPIERGKAAMGRLTAAVRQRHQQWRAHNAVYAFAAEIGREYQAHNPGLLARQAAYALLYAIPSVLLVLVSLAVLVERNTGFAVSAALQEFIATQTPGEVQPLLASLVQAAIVETTANAALLAALAALGIAVWSAAGGVGALMYAVNEVYDIRDTRSFVKATVTRLGVMLLGGILVVGAFILLIFGQRLADWLASGPVNLDPAITGLLTSGPLWSLGLLFASLLLLYWFSLDLPKSFRWLIPGAALAALAVAIVVTLLDLIVTFTNPGSAFGAAGGVLVLLWALFIVSQIVVIGAIVNAVLGRRHDRTLAAALAAHPGKPDCHREEPSRSGPDGSAICRP